MQDRMWHVGIAIVVVAGAAQVSHADEALDLKRAEESLAYTVKRYNSEKTPFNAKFSVDWRTIKDRKSLSRWADNCGDLIQAFTSSGAVCASTYASGSPTIPACLDLINQRVKAVRCIAQESVSDESKRRVELKGTTLVFHMIENNLNRDPARRLVEPLFPEVKPIIYAFDLEVVGEVHYHSKERKFPVTIDAQSFAATEHSANEAWERCDRTTGVLFQLAKPECSFSMCKGDAKKAEDFLKGITKLRCVWTDKETAPVKSGDTLVLSLGEWSRGERARGFTAFWALRKQLKIRGCGDLDVDHIKKADSPMEKACCPKDRNGKCMKAAKTVEMALPACMSDYAYKYLNPEGKPRCTKRYGLGFSDKQRKEAR